MTSEQVPDHEAIATRAYEIYLARGGTNGLAEEDWQRAEAELAGEEAPQTPEDAGPNVPIDTGGRGERSAEVMPDVEPSDPGEEPEQLPPGP